MIGINITPEEWEKIMARKARGALKEIADDISRVEARAADIIDDLGDRFSWEEFKRIWKGDNGSTDEVRYWYERKIAGLRKLEKWGTAEDYKNSLDSFTKFMKRQSFTFDHINQNTLSRYRKWMEDQGRSINTISKYLRELRAIFNDAIDAGRYDREKLPFGQRRFQIPKGRKKIQPFTKEEIDLILHFHPQDRWEDLAKDIFLFMYYGEGINVADIVKLKYSDLKGNRIVYYRTKTQGKTKHVRPLAPTIEPYMRRVIEKWGTKPASPDRYVFDVLQPGLNEKRIRELKKNWNKQLNKYFRRVCEKLEIKRDDPIRLYYARHSFANILKQSNVGIAMISQMLGHSDLKVTENYLDQFETEEVKEAKKYLYLDKKRTA